MKRFRLPRASACLVSLAAVFAGLALCGLLAPAGAQDYPNRPITLVVPFVPGGSTSVVSRIVVGGDRQRRGSTDDFNREELDVVLSGTGDVAVVIELYQPCPHRDRL